eukprot:TRINITY_DN9841_c0_g1_i2.p1 TRINITY_DN9841_c0_g1~~TRINITY_DN9841_c0_g1_i2.p1  ORF type:complete len:849 (+),score=109.56 TRINITY_DN9841_c0_g1_i2:52-2598(+)
MKSVRKLWEKHRRGSEGTAKESAEEEGNAVFSIPDILLQQRLRGEDPHIPKIMQICCVYLLEKGLTEEGIFRISADRTQVREMMRRFSRSEITSCIDLIGVETHVIAACIKEFLNDLVDSIIPTHIGKEFQEFLQDTLTVEDVVDMLYVLPTENVHVLGYLMVFLRKVADEQDTNKMDTENLSLMFGPTILRMEFDIHEIVGRRDIPNVLLCRYMIQNANELFPDEYEKILEDLAEGHHALSLHSALVSAPALVQNIENTTGSLSLVSLQQSGKMGGIGMLLKRNKSTGNMSPDDKAQTELRSNQGSNQDTSSPKSFSGMGSGVGEEGSSSSPQLSPLETTSSRESMTLFDRGFSIRSRKHQDGTSEEIQDGASFDSDVFPRITHSKSNQSLLNQNYLVPVTHQHLVGLFSDRQTSSSYQIATHTTNSVLASSTNDSSDCNESGSEFEVASSLQSDCSPASSKYPTWLGAMNRGKSSGDMQSISSKMDERVRRRIAFGSTLLRKVDRSSPQISMSSASSVFDDHGSDHTDATSLRSEIQSTSGVVDILQNMSLQRSLSFNPSIGTEIDSFGDWDSIPEDGEFDGLPDEKASIVEPVADVGDGSVINHDLYLSESCSLAVNHEDLGQHQSGPQEGHRRAPREGIKLLTIATSSGEGSVHSLDEGSDTSIHQPRQDHGHNQYHHHHQVHHRREYPLPSAQQPYTHTSQYQHPNPAFHYNPMGFGISTRAAIHASSVSSVGVGFGLGPSWPSPLTSPTAPHPRHYVNFSSQRASYPSSRDNILQPLTSGLIATPMPPTIMRPTVTIPQTLVTQSLGNPHNNLLASPTSLLAERNNHPGPFAPTSRQSLRHL